CAGRPLCAAAYSRASTRSAWLSANQESATCIRLADRARHPAGQGRPRGLQGGPFFRGQLGMEDVQGGGRLLGPQPGQGANGLAGRALAERELPAAAVLELDDAVAQAQLARGA